MKAPKQTLTSVYEKFLKNYRNKSTRAAYEATMRPLFQAIGGERRVSSVTALDLIDFTGDLKTPERNLAPASINKHIKHIKAFFNWCVRSDVIASSPAAKVQYVRVPKKKRRRMIDDEQQATLLRYTAFFPQKDAVVRIIIDTGCRRREIAEMRVRDLDLDHQEAIVTGKGDKQRIVWFGAECAKSIRRHLDQRGNADLTSYVFSRDGKPITPAALGQLFRRTCVAAGIGSYGPHQLRAKKITRLMNARVNPETVRAIVGHENVRTTLGYVSEDLKEARAVAREFALGGAPVEGKVLRLPTGTEGRTEVDVI